MITRSNNTLTANRLLNGWIHALSNRNFDRLSFLLIGLLTVLVYSNSWNNDFTNWDDQNLVLDNTSIRSLSLDNLKRIFTPSSGGTFQPVRVLSYAIDYRLWRLKPVGYHIVNTILHGLSAMMLYLVFANVLNQLRRNARRAEQSKTARQATHEGRRSGEFFQKSNRIISLFAVLLFVVHPVNVESVAWISSRKYGLVAFFSFTALYFFLRSSDTGRYRWFYILLAFLATGLAILSSPLAVVLPPLFIFYDYCRDQSNNVVMVLKKRFVYYLPYFLLSILLYPVIWNILVASNASDAVKSHYQGQPFYTFLSMSRVLYEYMLNLVFPFWLNNRYVNHISTTFFDLKIIVSLVTLFFVLCFIFLQAKRENKAPLFCVGWFLIALLPVANIIPISTMMADRYMYIPAVGLFLGLSLTLGEISENVGCLKKKNIIGGLQIILLISFSMLTVQRNRVWSNSITLWQDSLAKDPLNSLAHNNLGLEYHEQGEPLIAIQHYTAALKIDPSYADANYNMGNSLKSVGRHDDAIAFYQETLKIEPNYPKAHLNLGNTLKALGRNNDAIDHYTQALRISPGFADAHYNMGNTLAMEGKLDEAIRHYGEALKSNPGFAEAHSNLGSYLYKKGKIAQAVNHYLEALKIKPDFAEVHYNLGNVLTEQGDFNQAIHHFSEALKTLPDSSKVHNKLGIAYGKQGMYDEAIRHFSEAVKIMPDNRAAQDNLIIAMMKKEDRIKKKN